MPLREIEQLDLIDDFEEEYDEEYDEDEDRDDEEEEEEEDEDGSESQGTDLPFFKYKIDFIPTKSYRLNPMKRFVGCELEYDGIDKYIEKKNVVNVLKKWKASCVYDGSLSSRGFEIQTTPASGDRFIEQVTEICQALHKAKVIVKKECGFHVHVDASDYSYFQLHWIIRLYARFERALFQAVPPSRRDNGYCRKCGDYWMENMKGLEQLLSDGRIKSSKQFKKQVIDVIYGKEGELRRVRHDRRGGEPRYYALNLHSWYNGNYRRTQKDNTVRPTIECRLGAGTSNIDNIIHWGMLWAAIVEAGATMTRERFESMPKSSKEALLSISPTEETSKWLQKRWEKFDGAYCPVTEGEYAGDPIPF